MSSNSVNCFRGVQKTSTIDFPGKVAAVLFAGGCNFRCPFCYNVSLVKRTAPEIPWDYVWDFLRRRRNVLQGVVVSGGEPTLAPYLAAFLEQVRKLGLAVKLDTNGYNTQALGELLDGGLVDFVAMDIKNSPGKYARTCGLDLVDVGKVAESVRLLKESGVDYEFRTTVSSQLHTVEDFREIAAFCRGGRRYSLQPVHSAQTLSGQEFSAPSPETMEQMAEILRLTFDSVVVRK